MWMYRCAVVGRTDGRTTTTTTTTIMTDMIIAHHYRTPTLLAPLLRGVARSAAPERGWRGGRAKPKSSSAGTASVRLINIIMIINDNNNDDSKNTFNNI